jgi:hypothetical protein
MAFLLLPHPSILCSILSTSPPSHFPSLHYHKETHPQQYSLIKPPQWHPRPQRKPSPLLSNPIPVPTRPPAVPTTDQPALPSLHAPLEHPTRDTHSVEQTTHPGAPTLAPTPSTTRQQTAVPRPSLSSTAHQRAQPTTPAPTHLQAQPTIHRQPGPGPQVPPPLPDAPLSCSPPPR